MASAEKSDDLVRALTKVVADAAGNVVARDGSEIYVWRRGRIQITRDSLRPHPELRSAGIGGWCSLDAAEAMRLDPAAMNAGVERVRNAYPDIEVACELDIEEDDAANAEIFLLSGDRIKLATSTRPTVALFWASWDLMQRGLVGKVCSALATLSETQIVDVRIVAIDPRLEAVISAVEHERESAADEEGKARWAAHAHAWAGRAEDLGAVYSPRSLRITGLVPCLVVLDTAAVPLLSLPLDMSTDASALAAKVKNAVVSSEDSGGCAADAQEPSGPEFETAQDFARWLRDEAGGRGGVVDFEERWAQGRLKSIAVTEAGPRRLHTESEQA